MVIFVKFWVHCRNFESFKSEKNLKKIRKKSEGILYEWNEISEDNVQKN